MFLIVNIAAPACLDLLGAELAGSDWYRPDVSLANIHFDVALEGFLDGALSVPHVLEVSDVLRWYNSVRDPASQVAGNPMERVLFALLHIAKADISPMTVIWLFYAFESLLQTRVGENFGALVARFRLLLNLDDKQHANLKKKLRVLYDIRSSVVHGGFSITHIIQNELLDDRVHDSINKILQATDYGNCLLVASIQQVIRNGWRWPVFSERMEGDTISIEGSK